MCIRREKFILRNWLALFWGVGSLKIAGQASRLEAQRRADIAARD